MFNYSFKWIVQRITAILLIPLTFWFVYNCVLLGKSNYDQTINFFHSYLNSSLFLIMMISMLIHAKLGCETIVEDYISYSFFKKLFIYLLRIFFYFLIFITTISILTILNN